MINKLFHDTSLPSKLKGKAIFLDNDFLSVLFSDADVLTEFTTLFSKNTIVVYPLTEFEFLRSMYEPKQRTLMERFISNKFFSKYDTKEYYKDFPQHIENALLLSKIYAHQNTSKSSSLVDLLLAASLMYFHDITVLITGNKKDFPSCVFDLESVLNFEDKTSGHVQAYSVVKFNKGKFDSCQKTLEELQMKYMEDNKASVVNKS